jgi:hypothetical protein
MQYLLMIYDDEKVWAAMTEPQREQLMTDYRAYTESIVKSGQFRGGAQLQPSPTATLLREQKGKRATTDGPYAETREQLAGYYLVECDNLDQALTIAAGIPSVKVGGAIEVRPLVPRPGNPRVA